MIQAFQGTQSYRLNASEAEQQGNIRQLPATVGTCRSRFTAVADGFTVVRSDYHPLRPLIEETNNPHSDPMLVMTFGIAGKSSFRGDRGQETLFAQNHLTITSYHGSAGERHFDAGSSVSQLRLLLRADSVAHWFGDAVRDNLFSSSNIINHQFTPFSTAAAALLTQLEQCAGDPLLHQIHTLNLLALHRHLLQDLTHKPFHPGDEQRIEQARQWMAAHLAEPFSLNTLAMAVGLSDYKLKQGFHHRFNMTPGQMLLQMRMEKAHRLLEQGYQVAQAGWQVGYRHANNFSVAFHRYFGRHASAVLGKKQ